MKVAEFILIVLLRLYRATLSPVLGFLCGGLGLGCRFHPTCSQYAIEAVQRFGAVKGSVLAAKRLARCHPWGGSGYDPVPQGRGEKEEERGESTITITSRIKNLKKFMVLHERQAHGS